MKHKKPDSAIELFELGTLRHTGNFSCAGRELLSLNLGPGNKIIRDTFALDYPEWDAENDPIPFDTASVGAIYALHFFEHLRDPRPCLRECARVLVTGGALNIVVPHAGGTAAFQDLDHKSFYVADTWKTLLDSGWYGKDKQGFPFHINFNMVMGVTERNLMLVTQLIKV